MQQYIAGWTPAFLSVCNFIVLTHYCINKEENIFAVKLFFFYKGRVFTLVSLCLPGVSVVFEPAGWHQRRGQKVKRSPKSEGFIYKLQAWKDGTGVSRRDVRWTGPARRSGGVQWMRWGRQESSLEQRLETAWQKPSNRTGPLRALKTVRSNFLNWFRVAHSWLA